MKLPEGAKLYDLGLANNFLYLTLNAQATKVHQRKVYQSGKATHGMRQNICKSFT